MNTVELQTERLLVDGVRVKKFVVDEINRSDSAITVIGRIEAIQRDVLKNYNWWASSALLLNGISVHWVVRRTVNILPICRGPLHDALSVYIREKLNERSKELFSQLVVPAEVPQLLETYNCTCSFFDSRMAQATLKDLEIFCNGKFLKMGNNRCITCVCGQNWWEWKPVKSTWKRVVDVAAWNNLLQNDGFATEDIVFFIDAVYSYLTLQKKTSFDKEFFLFDTK